MEIVFPLIFGKCRHLLVKHVAATNKKKVQSCSNEILYSMFRHKINPPMLRSGFLIKINNIKDRSLHIPTAEAVISFYLIPADEALTIVPSV